MDKFRRVYLHEGQLCIIIDTIQSTEHFGKAVTLTKRHFRKELDGSHVGYWETEPTLCNVMHDGSQVPVVWRPDMLMCMNDPILSNELIQERRNDCWDDASMSSYIFGRDLGRTKPPNKP